MGTGDKRKEGMRGRLLHKAANDTGGGMGSVGPGMWEASRLAQKPATRF